MKVTVLGSSDAFNSAGRCHSCYLVEGPGCGPVMVDIGGSGLLALRKAGRSPIELTGIAITHLHGDHIGGMPFLLLDAAYNDPRTAPLPMVGPARLADRLDTLFRGTYKELTAMNLPFEMSITEITPGESAPLSGFDVAAFAADHMDPPDRPLSLRFRSPQGKTVTFSGDTAMNPSLLEAAADVDLLIAECSAVEPPIGRHCTWLDWKPVLPTLTAKRVVLTHLNHRVRNEISRLLLEAPDDVDLTFADDGMIFEL